MPTYPHVTVVPVLQQNHVSQFSLRGGGVRTPCKTRRKKHRKIPRCFDLVSDSNDPSRVLVILPAARVGCPYTDDPSRVPVILPAARVGFAILKRRL